MSTRRRIVLGLVVITNMIMGGCTNSKPVETDQPIATTTTTSQPALTPTIEATESVTPFPLVTSASETEQPQDGLVAPYEFSELVENDFSIMDRMIPAQGCSGDLTEQQCIDLYGTIPLIPDGVKLTDNGSSNGYHGFTIENTFTGSTISFQIIESAYDSYLSDVHYTLDENNELLIQFSFDYTNDIRSTHPEAYDIEQRYYQTAGPVHSHTIYYLNETDTECPGHTIAQSNGYTVTRFNLHEPNYVGNMPDPVASQSGMDYIAAVEWVKIDQ